MTVWDVGCGIRPTTMMGGALQLILQDPTSSSSSSYRYGGKQHKASRR